MLIIIHKNNNSVKSGDYGHTPSCMNVIPEPAFSIFIGGLARHLRSCQRHTTGGLVNGESNRNSLLPVPGLARPGVAENIRDRQKCLAIFIVSSTTERAQG
jgi:hypothetical protein